MSDYDFTGLTETQKALLTFGGWQIGSQAVPVQPGKRTVAKLIERGLLVTQNKIEPCGRWRMTVTEYFVPIPVHMAWCQHCTDTLTRQGKRQVRE